jgi:hypothetical protein
MATVALNVSAKMDEFHSEISKHPAERDLWLHQRNANKVRETEMILSELGVEEGERFKFLRGNSCGSEV